jgi:DNA-directed RNA polymerase specialized sigma24 family protein
MNPMKDEQHQDKIEPLLLEWESCIKELAYIRYAYLVESALAIQQRHTSAADLLCLKQLAVAELWNQIDQSLSLPSDFELKAKRAIESRIKSSKRSSIDEDRAAEKLKAIADGVQWPSEELEHQEMQDIIEEALQDLSHEQSRALFLLHGLGGSEQMKAGEVAEWEKVSVQTIRNRKRKAYRLLRENAAIRSLVS